MSRSNGTPSRLSYMSYPASLAYSLGQPIITKTYEFTRVSANFTNASLVACVSTVLFIMAFSSPFWLVSFEYTYSDFRNAGLWEFCFDSFRYPKYQFDHKFDGCNYVYSDEYRIIWEWILPMWFMSVQLFMVIALLCLLACLFTAALVVTRWPLQFVMRYEWRMTAWCAGLMGAAALFELLCLIVFGLMCWSREWLLNPNFNYLGWSYYFLLFAGFFSFISFFMMTYEVLLSRQRKEYTNEMMQLETPGAMTPGLRGGEVPQDLPYHANPPTYSETQQYPGDPPGIGFEQVAGGYSGPQPEYSREQSVYSAASGGPYSSQGYPGNYPRRGYM